MKKNLFIYDRSSSLYQFDSSISDNYYFEYEIENYMDNYEQVNKHRYLVNIESLSQNSMYIYNPIIVKSKNGYIMECLDTQSLFIEVGENIYLLAHTTADKKQLSSIVYTFLNIQNTHAFVDVSIFQSFFKTYKFILNLYKHK